MRTCQHCGQSFPDDALHCPNDGSSLVPEEERGNLAGETLDGRFYLEERIGAGGLGEVYRGRHTKMGKPFAVKVLHANLLSDEQLVRRFDREAMALSRLEHPCCVAVTDYGHSDYGPYIVMELVQGTPLSRFTRGEGMPLSRALNVMTKMMAGLEHAHAQGIIHRDLKPDNVMLVPNPMEPGEELPKILDFGIAKFRSGFAPPGGKSLLTMVGVLIGTPAYMAPEQASLEPDDDEVTAAVDIYSAGVILYELVCGRRPFPGPDPVSLLHQHLHQPALPPSSLRPQLPDALDRVVLRALEKKPEDRFPSAEAMRAALKALQPLPAALGAALPAPPADASRAEVTGFEATVAATSGAADPAMVATVANRPASLEPLPGVQLPETIVPGKPKSRIAALAAVVALVALGAVGFFALNVERRNEKEAEHAALPETERSGTIHSAEDRPETAAALASADGGGTEAVPDAALDAALPTPKEPAWGLGADEPDGDRYDEPYEPPAELADAARRWEHKRSRDGATRALLQYLSEHGDDASAHLFVARLFLRELWRPNGMALVERAVAKAPELRFDLETTVALSYAYTRAHRGKIDSLLDRHGGPDTLDALVIGAATIPDASTRDALVKEIAGMGEPTDFGHAVFAVMETPKCGDRKELLERMDTSRHEVRVLLDHLREHKCLKGVARKMLDD